MTFMLKRRWYQFSLMELFAAVFVVSIFFATVGRIAYLQRMAAFHDSEATRFANKPSVSDEMDDEDSVHFAEHVIIARRFRAAMWRPWTNIDTTPPVDANWRYTP